MDKPSKPTPTPKELSDYEHGYLDGLKEARAEHERKTSRDMARLRAEAEQYEKDKRAKD